MVEYSYTFSAAGNIRPDVRAPMFIVAANDTPLLATLGQRPVAAKNFSWFLEDLPNPTELASPEAEATVTVGGTGARPTYTGVVTKHTLDFNVTETMRSTEQYSVTDEYYYKAQKAGLALAKLFEADLHWSEYSAYNATGSTPGLVGVIPWLCESGALRHSGAASGSIGGNTVTSTYFSTWRDCKKIDNAVMTESTFNTTIGNAWAQGCSIPDVIGFCGADVKRRLSNFNLIFNTGATSSAHDVSITRTVQREMKTRQISVDHFDTDFGMVSVVLDRYMNSSFSYTATGQATSSDNFLAGGDDTIFFIDPAYFRRAVLRPFMRKDLAPSDDSQRGYVVAELGLEVGNPKAGFGLSRTDGAT